MARMNIDSATRDPARSAIANLSPFIAIRSLSKTFATLQGERINTLTDIDVDIAAGRFATIVGPSGCGKSTLLRILAGLDIAAVFAVVGAIVGEFVGAQFGLGVRIPSMNARMDTAGSFSDCIVLALMGLALNSAIPAVQRRVLFWAPSEASQRAINSDAAGD
jgi:ABC-type molybdenum transport system ATPase subunit/photorepair protein PhrA